MILILFIVAYMFLWYLAVEIPWRDALDYTLHVLRGKRCKCNECRSRR